MSATLASLTVSSRAVAVRLVIPWRGAWFAEVDVDPDTATDAPSGPVTLTLGTTALKGTTSVDEGGRFVSSVKAIVWAGANGWSKLVDAQDYASDAPGVSSTSVLGAAAAIVGETLLETAPGILGINYARFGKGPASRAFGDLDWYVDLAGVTHVGTWPTVQPDESLQVLSYEPERLVLEVACDVPVLPGTQVTDSRFDGTLTVRSVEQSFTSDKVRAKLWCSVSGVDRLMSVITNIVRETSQRHLLRCYRYRLVLEGVDGRVQLQCVNKALGAPDTLPISVWAGMQGDTANLALSSTLLVHFAEGDPTLPVVIGFEPGVLPTKRTVDASVELDLGPTAPTVAIGALAAAIKLGPVPLPLASGPTLTTFLDTVGGAMTAAAAVVAPSSSPVTPWETLVSPALAALFTAVAGACVAAGLTVQTTVVKGT